MSLLVDTRYFRRDCPTIPQMPFDGWWFVPKYFAMLLHNKMEPIEDEL